MDERLREGLRLFYAICTLPYLGAVFSLGYLGQHCGHPCAEPILLLGASAILAGALILVACFLLKALRKRKQSLNKMFYAIASQMVLLLGLAMLML